MNSLFIINNYFNYLKKIIKNNKQMSIKGDVIELKNINQEIKRLNDRKKTLNKRAKVVEQKIIKFLESKEQPGVKYQGTAVLVESKNSTKTKKTKERENDSISVLQKYGISNPEQVLKELLNARKGETVEKKKLKIKDLKKY
jgi:hypothetical protein|tara:strand:- start:906 stop:1331 length:426 start_codon:yes stop_codon:yes gene_type:complete